MAKTKWIKLDAEDLKVFRDADVDTELDNLADIPQESEWILSELGEQPPVDLSGACQFSGRPEY